MFFAPLQKLTETDGRSGKYVLLMIIPLVNIWISINLFFFDGEGDNQYGTRPIT